MRDESYTPPESYAAQVLRQLLEGWVSPETYFAETDRFERNALPDEDVD